MTATQPTLIDEPGTPRKRFVGPHIAQWLADQSQHLRAERCHQCRADTLRGLDDMWAAGPIEVDPTPLSAIGEALALLAGRRTVACEHWHGLRFTRRRHWQITSRPAGTRGLDIYAEHRCGADPLPTIPSAFTPPTTSTDVECPF